MRVVTAFCLACVCAELLVQLVTKNRGTLLQKGGELAEKNGIKLHLYDVSARKI